MTFRIRDRIGMQAIATTDTVQQHPLGTVIEADDPTYGSGTFIYLKGVASTAVGSWAVYNSDDFSTALLAAAADGPVAVAMSANVADQYGWYQIRGKAVGKALTGFVDDASVYATSTAGSVDDAVVAGDRINRAKGASAVDTPSTGLAEFEIENPFVDPAAQTDQALDATAVGEVADSNTEGGIPVIFRYALADAASGNVEITMTHKVRVIDAWVVKTSADGHATEDTVTIGKGASAITDAMAIGAPNDKGITRAATIDDANHEIAAAGALRITWAKGSSGGNNVACEIYVMALRVA